MVHKNSLGPPPKREKQGINILSKQMNAGAGKTPPPTMLSPTRFFTWSVKNSLFYLGSSDSVFQTAYIADSYINVQLVDYLNR